MSKKIVNIKETFLGLIVSGWKLEVLSRFVDKPEYSYTIRELSKKTRGSYGSVRDFVHKLSEKDVVKKERKGASFLVHYNLMNRYHVLIRQLLRTESERLVKVAEDYSKKLYEKERSKIYSVILFGSVARGSATSESDIDILVITNSSAGGKMERTVRKLAGDIGYKHGVSIIPLIEEFTEFKENLLKGEKFEKNIKRDGKILEGGKI